MKRDDRPKQSKHKKPLAEGAAPPPVCSECGFRFTEEAVARGQRYKIRKDGDAVCVDRQACRVRQLTTLLGKELGATPPEAWLFFRYPRDLVKARMDVRPKNWRETGWQPRYTLPERCMASILYHSWCYPVCLPFAVQLAGTCAQPRHRELDDDEILGDQYKQPMALREMDIARILNEHQPNVSRALKRLQDGKDLRVDEDGVLYPAAKLLDLSIAERYALYQPDRIAGDPDDELRGVPKRYRKLLVLIETHCEADISSDIFAEVISSCTAFNDALRNIRTERDASIEQACSRGVSLLPDLEKPSRAKPSPSAQASINARAVGSSGVEVPAPSSPQSAVQTPHRSVGQPFSGDEGKGALGKLDRPRPCPETDRPSGADNPFTPQIRQWLEQTFSELPTSLEDRELDQIAATIRTDQHLEQFQKAAKRQKDPRGWKVFVKIALECQKHHGKYKQAAPGGVEESYLERKYREEIESRKGKANG